MILAHGGRWVFTTKDYSLTIGDFRNSEMSQLAYPHCFTLSAARNGYTLQGRFVVTDLYHLTDIFAKQMPTRWDDLRLGSPARHL